MAPISVEEGLGGCIVTLLHKDAVEHVKAIISVRLLSHTHTYMHTHVHAHMYGHTGEVQVKGRKEGNVCCLLPQWQR